MQGRRTLKQDGLKKHNTLWLPQKKKAERRKRKRFVNSRLYTVY